LSFVLFSESPPSEARGLPGVVFMPKTSALITCTLCRNSNKIQEKTKINYCILTPHYVFSIFSYFSLLGYRSQQWLHQYNITSCFLVTNLNNHEAQRILAVVRRTTC
jgi:hypothetical protein